MKINKTTEKWEKTGLLQKLSGKTKDSCAQSLEELSLFLVGKYEDKVTKQSESICSCVLPIMTRLYMENITPVPDPKTLHDSFVKFEKSTKTKKGEDRERILCEKFVKQLSCK